MVKSSRIEYLRMTFSFLDKSPYVGDGHKTEDGRLIVNVNAMQEANQNLRNQRRPVTGHNFFLHSEAQDFCQFTPVSCSVQVHVLKVV